MERTRNLRHLETPKAIGSINGSFSDLPVLSEATSGVILPSPVRQTYRSGGETMRPNPVPAEGGAFVDPAVAWGDPPPRPGGEGPARGGPPGPGPRSPIRGVLRGRRPLLSLASSNRCRSSSPAPRW